LVVPFWLTAAATTLPAGFVTRNVVPLTPCTASLNVAVMFAPTATAVALTAGVRAVTVGAVLAAAVVKLQETSVSALLALSRMPVAPPSSVAVYCVLLARLAVGSSVATRVVAL
jgi:hypothetical protein